MHMHGLRSEACGLLVILSYGDIKYIILSQFIHLVARDAHCNITMDNSVARDIHCDIMMTLLCVYYNA